MLTRTGGSGHLDGLRRGGHEFGGGDECVSPAVPEDVAISSPVSMKFTGTSTTAARAVANARTAYRQLLRDNSATRSPAANPLACRAAATRSTSASNWAKVSVTSPSMMATLSGTRRAVRRGMSPMV